MKESCTCSGCSNCSHAPGNAEEFAMAKQDPTTFCPDAYTEKAQYCGNNNKESSEEERGSFVCEFEPYTDLRTLPDGTHFEVVNGLWTGYVFERDGQKYMHIDDLEEDHKLTGKEDLIIDIIDASLYS